MPKPIHTNPGDKASAGKQAAEGSFGSYLATNFEQEVAALNRAGSRSQPQAASGGFKINGVVVASAAVILVSIVGIVVLANIVIGRNSPPPPAASQPTDFQVHRNVQGTGSGFSSRKQYQLERPPSFVVPKHRQNRPAAPQRRPASVD